MDQRNKNYGGHRGRGPRYSKPKFFQRQKIDQVAIEASPFAEQFLVFQKEMDAKNDRYERLVQRSRDLTIESKRTIFQLHRIIGEESKADILPQVRARLDEVRKNSLLAIATEVKDYDYHLYQRAFSPGLQEFVEAVTYYYYLKENRLATWEEIQAECTFDSKGRVPSLKLTQRDYILGVADLTGEVMRKCITAVGDGDLQQPFIVCHFLRSVHSGFQMVGSIGGREVLCKIITLYSSLSKVERACYSLKIRGSEIPKKHLTDLFETAEEVYYDSDRSD